MTRDVTVGVDIGTTSVKAVAVDGAGTVLARSRRVHPVSSPRPDAFEHDPDVAWRADVVAAFDEVAAGLDVAAVDVAAMVPSLCAVDADGRALTPGLLYGDWRGGPVTGQNPSESGELVSMLRWCAAVAPEAAGFWPAQAVANHALCGVAAIDSVVAMTTLPLFDLTAWDPAVAEAAGASIDQLPRIVHGSEACGTTPAGAAVAGGTVDAFGEQIVAGADGDGDVLVICGTTLMTWAVVDDWREVPGLWTIPHSAPGKILVGGPSNAGGLFLDWALGLLADGPAPADPAAVPVWEPYVRGERTPLHDPYRRAGLHGLDLTMGPGAVRRAAYEAAGFTVRHHLDLAGVSPRRLVATGGGVRVGPWVQALADCTGCPVDIVAVPEGGAYGAAYLARVTAGLEPDASGAARWAAVDHRIEPDATWAAAAGPRYQRFRELAGPPGPPPG
jgi:xylulokinase